MRLVKPRISVYLAMLLAVLGAMVALRHCGSVDSVDGSCGDTIMVGIEYSPLSCYMYEDTLGGFEYDLLRLIARTNGVEMMYVPSVSLSKSIDALESGKIKMLAAQFPMTADYKERLVFSDPVYLDRYTLVQLRDSVSGELQVTSALDLAGDTVMVVKDSPAVSRIHNLMKEIGDTISVIEEGEYNSEQLFIMVATGKVKYAVMNESTARIFARRYPRADVSMNVGFTQFQSWAFNPVDSVLCDSVNVWLARVKASEDYDRLLSRYFGSVR